MVDDEGYDEWHVNMFEKEHNKEWEHGRIKTY